MKGKIALITILLAILAFVTFLYLNRSYSRIYARVIVPDLSYNWTTPIELKNSNFQNTVKYAALGDSLSVGIGSIDYRNALPYIIASKLSQQMSVSLYNFAVMGATADAVRVMQLEKAIAVEPNYVTVFIGTNDVHKLDPVDTFESELDYIIKNLKERTKAKIIVFNVPLLGNNNLVWFPYNIFFDIQIRQYNQVISRVAQKYEVNLIDLYTPTKNDFANRKNFYSVDDFHPSGEGYQMWGTLVIPKDL